MSVTKAAPSAVIWSWRAPADARDAALALSKLRKRAAARSLVASAGATLLGLFVSRTLCAVALGMALVLLLGGLLSPRRLDLLFAHLAVGLGKLTTLVVLVPIFYGVFLPFGLLMRRGRRDALKRRFDPALTTYWEQAEPRQLSKEAYERQF
jgi:hypothetical protein